MSAMKVGDIEIEPIMDGSAVMPVTQAYEAMSEESWLPHRQLLTQRGQLEIALGGFLVRSGDRLVLVDTGVGMVNLDPFKGGLLIESLAAVGVQPEDITDVILTHLHFDHVGWTTRKGDVVFKQAAYRCDRRDWEHFVGPDPGATKKLSPLESRLSLFDESGPLLPGIDVQSAPGHTPGSTIVVVSSGAERAMLLGDVVHCPVELLDDEWAGMSDVDPALAKRTRNALARELEGTDIPIAAAHFPGLQFGRLLVGEGKRQWVVA
jgi:glyoxylase-like metal-dependent hydrolase (beta-lactamase superfamily II)